MKNWGDDELKEAIIVELQERLVGEITERREGVYIL